jgi:hypothetical protein
LTGSENGSGDRKDRSGVEDFSERFFRLLLLPESECFVSVGLTVKSYDNINSLNAFKHF